MDRQRSSSRTSTFSLASNCLFHASVLQSVWSSETKSLCRYEVVDDDEESDVGPGNVVEEDGYEMI